MLRQPAPMLLCCTSLRFHESERWTRAYSNDGNIWSGLTVSTGITGVLYASIRADRRARELADSYDASRHSGAHEGQRNGERLLYWTVRCKWTTSVDQLLSACAQDAMSEAVEGAELMLFGVSEKCECE